MALTELEHRRGQKLVGAYLETRRPPIHLRSKLDYSFRIQGQSVEIFEVRPVWRNPQESSETAIAKATYVRTISRWRVFWQPSDLKSRSDEAPRGESPMPGERASRLRWHWRCPEEVDAGRPPSPPHRPTIGCRGGCAIDRVRGAGR